MTLSENEIRNLINMGEDSNCEFKQIRFKGNRPVSPQRKDLADEMIAFANADGGVLLCGVTDKGEIQGLDFDQRASLNKYLAEVATDTIKPVLKIEVFNRELDGKAIVVAKVPKSNKVHERDGITHIRIGATKRLLEGDERSSLVQNRDQNRFLGYDIKIVRNTGFNTLSKSLWQPLLSSTGVEDPERGLINLRLLKADDTGNIRATVAGILLCTEAPEKWLPQATITATCYRGLDRASGQIDAQEIAGPLNSQIIDAVHFVKRNMRVAARKNPERENIPEYNLSAVFESVVNAVVHRDYALTKRRIRLSIFQGHLEVDSPGSLPNGMTIENMDISQATRNEVIASVFGRTSVGRIAGATDRKYLMERRGDGVSIIKKRTYEATGELPVYRLIDRSNLLLKIPATKLELKPAGSTISVHSNGLPLEGVDVLSLFPNKTWHHSTTNQDGEAWFDFYTTHLPMTVYAAKEGYTGGLALNWRPDQEGKRIELTKMPFGGGSVIFPNATGFVPELKGRLNPILDTHDRMYLYADNIAIEDGLQQPVSFKLGDPIKLTDSYGSEMSVTILKIIGRSALIEYKPLKINI